MENTKLNFSKKTICIITGGSRGIGKTIATHLAKKLKIGSTLLLLARNQTTLDKTKQELQTVNSNLNVLAASVDLANTNKGSLSTIIDNAIPNPTEYENALLIQNAGNIGNISVHASKMDDIEEWRKFYALELFAPVVLTSVFIAKFTNPKQKMYIVNMTSLLGHIPMEFNAQFGSAKAARDFYYKVMALEEPNINILKYCPGPTKTDLIDEFLKPRNLTEAEKKTFKEKCLSVDVTVAKLVRILENGEYKSGQFIDYFDDEPGHPGGPAMKSRDF